MKLIVIPPIRAPFSYRSKEEGQFMIKEILKNLERKGQMAGVEYDVDDGWERNTRVLARDEEFFTYLSAGFLDRVKQYSEGGKYDAIVSNSSIDPAFFAVKQICKIPISCAMHAAAHMASLIGERFSIIELTDAMAIIDRRKIESYGLGHKLASVRPIAFNDTEVSDLNHTYPKEERRNVPECRKVIDAMVAQGIAAIEKERADTLLIGCPAIQLYEDEVREGLDKAGYSEVPLIIEVAAGVEMAKAMVNMKIKQAARAYPSDELKRKPEFR